MLGVGQGAKLASDNTTFRGSVLVGVLLSPLRLAALLTLGFAGLLVASWTIDWIFVFRVWPDGVEHLRGLLAMELARGVELAVRQGADPGEVTGLANFVYEVVFEHTGVHGMGQQFAKEASLAIPDTIVRRAFVEKWEWLESAMVGTQLLGVRIATLARGAPLLLLMYLVGLTDGFTQRSVRKWGGGAESANLYHRGKYSLITVAALGGLAIALWPAPVCWEACLATIAVVVGLLARLQWQFYKKHE